MCEVRFSLNEKDGKLQGMVDAIPKGIRAEVTKEALRYFLAGVRDGKLESYHIDSSLLESFKTDVKQNMFSIEDMFKILDSRAVAQQSVINTTTVAQQVPTPTQETQVLEEDAIGEIDEFDLDLNNSFNEEKSSSVSVNIDDLDMEF